MGSSLRAAAQNYPPLTTQERHDHVMRLLASNKQQAGKMPSVKAPAPSSTFSYNPIANNPLSGNTMTIQPYGGTNPFAGMTFGGTPSASTGLLSLGQNVIKSPAKTYISNGGGGGFSGLSGGPAFSAPIIVNPGLNFSATTSAVPNANLAPVVLPNNVLPHILPPFPIPQGS